MHRPTEFAALVVAVAVADIVVTRGSARIRCVEVPRLAVTLNQESNYFTSGQRTSGSEYHNRTFNVPGLSTRL